MGNTVKIDVVALREGLKDLSLAQLEEKYKEFGYSNLWKKGANKAIAVDNLINALTSPKEPIVPNGSETEKVLKEAEESESEVSEEDSVDELEEIEPGEYEIDQDTLDEYPNLVEQGFNIGDILVIEEGKPWSKKQDVVRSRSIEEVDEDIKEQNANISEKDITDPADIAPDSSLNEEEYLASKDGVDNNLINGVSRETINAELSGLNGGAVESDEPNIEEDEEEDEILDGNEIVKEYEPEVIDESKFTEEDIQENMEICQANLKDALPATRIVLLRKLEALEAALIRKQSK